MVHTLPEDGGFPPKHVAVNKEIFCFIYNMCISLGRPRRGWEDIIKMDLQEVGSGNMEFIELVQYRDRWRAFLNACYRSADKSLARPGRKQANVSLRMA